LLFARFLSQRAFLRSGGKILPHKRRGCNDLARQIYQESGPFKSVVNELCTRQVVNVGSFWLISSLHLFVYFS
jgi:hypothetical protein